MTVVKNYFFNLMLTLANLLFPILSFPYVSRILGPEGIGKVQFAFSFALYFSLIASLGIPIYGVKEIAKYKDDKEGRSKVFSELITIYFITSTCLTVAYLIVIYTFPYFSHDRETYLAAGILVFMSFCFIEWLYSGMEEFKSIALRSVAFKLTNLVLLYLLVKTRTDFRIYLYLMMFSFIGNNILSMFLLRQRVSFKLSGLGLRKHITPLLYILGTTLAASMYTEMDTVLLGFLSDNRTVGLYTAAVKFSKISIPFVTSMGVILLPRVGKDFAEMNLNAVQQTLNQTFRFLVFFSVPLVFGLVMLAPELISLFSGHEFLPAASSMRIMALLPMIIGFAHMLLYMILVPSGLNKGMFFCVIGGVITSVSLNVLLVPFYKEVGSSIANISAEIVVTSLYIYIINKHYKFHYNWLLFGEAVISAAIFIPIITGLKMLLISPVIIIILAMVGCIVSYMLVQLLIFKNKFVYEVLYFVKIKLKTGA